jgi:hypothetical protein
MGKEIRSAFRTSGIRLWALDVVPGWLSGFMERRFWVKIALLRFRFRCSGRACLVWGRIQIPSGWRKPGAGISSGLKN